MHHFRQPTPTLIRDGRSVLILDQTRLPFERHTIRLDTLTEAARAITTMQVRGAPLIGVTAAHGVALALRDDASDVQLEHALEMLAATRPTAVNLHWALARMRARLQPLDPGFRHEAAWDEAAAIARSDAETCAAIGHFGVELIQAIADRRPGPVRILTHCNAGWLATLGSGTALAPVYEATARAIPVSVWVSETRPRNQGMLTEWELRQAGVPHRVIADNAAGWLIAQGDVDLVITGADRIAANGDSANKIGTYLKALAAHAHKVPFYIAAPLSTIDFACEDGADIPIELRDADEVRLIAGMSAPVAPDAPHHAVQLRLLPEQVEVANPAFDVTPASLISGIITEYGIHTPNTLISLNKTPAV